MTVKQLLTLLLFSSFLTLTHGQAREDNRRPSSTKTEKKFDGFDADRVVVGGNFGAFFGTVTFVELSPTIGYKLTENLLAGVGARYIYFREGSYSPPIISNNYGGGPFAQYFFLENLIAHVEYEYLNVQQIPSKGRVPINSFFVGGGYRSDLGGNAFVGILLLYDLIGDLNSPYTNPVLRIGFGVGL